MPSDDLFDLLSPLSASSDPSAQAELSSWNLLLSEDQDSEPLDEFFGPLKAEIVEIPVVVRYGRLQVTTYQRMIRSTGRPNRS